MNFHRISSFVFISLGAVVVLSPSAQAASFQTNFTQSMTGANASKGDIWLNSITQKSSITQQNVTFNNFSFVKTVDILSNTPITGVKSNSTSTPGNNNNNTGAASTDKGDLASSPIAVSGLKNPTGTEIATFLGNKNLNNIIDTEDNGSFKMNLFFDQLIQKDDTGLDNLFFWERGMNSNLDIQAIDSNGKLIGNLVKLTKAQQNNAGYKIDTTEIAGAQNVGSWGVSLQQLGVNAFAGIQIIANGTSYNGPDFKVIARSSPPPRRKVPEPGTIAALGLMTLSAFGINKKNKNLVTQS
ncbi:exosortase-dependent surface protein XDP2 [Calothrix sp. UHCC 0171]|uniref:exosortase-dependent surface protein XDP2 n=1 Tax=Calothrix sp. UHCC 0171 TaxID=3110245 RepID=UPI002B2165B8|nr:exosortase-dependent surface protein XDP2 [Calothrix sp. UHCC 0171]MEA5571327.1 exosortase-dependent surface protein XDP2 [Calothrix sp. UHCC 0171]